MRNARFTPRPQASRPWPPGPVEPGWMRPEGGRVLERLTHREFEVMRHIAWGLTNAEAGTRLGISTRTVEIHRRNAINKLGARNTADAVRIVVAESLRQATGERGRAMAREIVIFPEHEARR